MKVAFLGIPVYKELDSFYKTWSYLEIVLGSGGYPPEEDLLRRSSSQGHAHSVVQLLCGVEVLLLGQVLRIPQTLAPGDDGDLEEGVGVLQEPADHRVAGFVVGHRLLLLRLEHVGLLFQTGNHTLDGSLGKRN